MDKKSVYMICISILIGFIILGISIYNGMVNNALESKNEFRYELITHGQNIMVFDRQTGDYSQKFLFKDGGPTDWEINENPMN